MAVTQLNVRIDEEVKRAGDAVLERFGVPAVQLIRATWQYMADYQRLPDFASGRDSVSGLADERIAFINAGEGMAMRLARGAGIRAEFEQMTFEEIRESAFEEMLIERDEVRERGCHV